MVIYLVLIVLILVFSLISRVAFRGERRKSFVLISFGICLYCIYVFRDFSVGRDILGYYDIYESISGYALFDASWTWMEWGYVLLMKLFSLMGLSFRCFLAFVYAVVLIPLFVFIKRYSKDVTLSLIIYMCFQFFVFSMSALRQSMAMSICLIAYMMGKNNGLIPFLKYCILVLMAVLIHRSAIVFAPAYFLMRFKLDFRMIVAYSVGLILALNFKDYFITYIGETGEVVSTAFQENLSIGAFFYFVCFVILVSLFVNLGKLEKLQLDNMINKNRGFKIVLDQSLSYYLCLLICGCIIQFVFRGFLLMRAATYYQIFLLLVLPGLVVEFPKEIRPALKVVIIVGMVAIFYFATLLRNELDIVPYHFF